MKFLSLSKIIEPLRTIGKKSEEYRKCSTKKPVQCLLPGKALLDVAGSSTVTHILFLSVLVIHQKFELHALTAKAVVAKSAV